MGNARRFGDDAGLWTLRAGDLVARVTDHGATLVELHVPDRHGTSADVVLGYDDVTGYRDGGAYLGATIGRVANRIRGATFELDGRHYDLAANEGANHLHGGAARSFDGVRWDVVEARNDALTLAYVSPDGEEGYPGRLDVTATYALTARSLAITYRASASRRTPIAMTNHTYWNLAGHGSGTVLDHVIEVHADEWTPVDAELIPTGEIASVDGQPVDLRTPVRLRDPVEALRASAARGLDHNLVLRAAGDAVRFVAALYDPPSGRVLELSTDQPGLQVYSGNLLAPERGKDGASYDVHGGICLEPQTFPDAVHLDAFPSVVIEPDATYVWRAVAEFALS